MNGSVLVTGITGNVGMSVAETLLKHGVKVKGAVTNIEKAKKNIPWDVEWVRFDFLDPTTYGEALKGVDRIFLMRPPVMSNPNQMKPFIDLAKDAGVKHIVFLSLLGIERNPIPPHYRIEKYVRNSGVPYTFLRPSFFMQNLNTTHQEDIKERNDIYIPAGKALVSFIDTRDIGEAGANVLLEPEKHQNKGYSLTGPEAITYYDAADIFSDVLDRKIVYSNPSALSFRKEMIRRGMPKAFVNVMVALYMTTKFGMAKRVTEELEPLLKRKPTTMRQYVEDYKSSWE